MDFMHVEMNAAFSFHLVDYVKNSFNVVKKIAMNFQNNNKKIDYILCHEMSLLDSSFLFLKRNASLNVRLNLYPPPKMRKKTPNKCNNMNNSLQVSKQDGFYLALSIV